MTYRVLEAFRVLPGANENGDISEEYLDKWIAAAEAYAEEIGYQRAFHSRLGRLLSYAPVGFDGLYPHESVRYYFEHHYNLDTANGFAVGKYSQRGVFTVTGGIQEKNISNSFRKDASKLRILYPRTASVLDKLADWYQQDSIYEQQSELLDSID